MRAVRAVCVVLSACICMLFVGYVCEIWRVCMVHIDGACEYDMECGVDVCCDVFPFARCVLMVHVICECQVDLPSVMIL